MTQSMKTVQQRGVVGGGMGGSQGAGVVRRTSMSQPEIAPGTEGTRIWDTSSPGTLR